MNQYSLLTEKNRDAVVEKLQQSPSKLSNEWKLSQVGGTTCVSYKFNKKDAHITAEKIASMLSEIIQYQVAFDFSEAYLKTREDLTYIDKLQIKNTFMMSNCLTSEEGISYIAYYYIYAPLLESLKTYKFIHLDGWLTFRTKPYKKILYEMLDQVVEDYLLKQEYENFVFLIRENKKLQKPLEDVLHLIPHDKDGIHILNKGKKDVTTTYIKDYCEELLEDPDVKMEDLIMNILITVAPYNIVVHQKEQITNKEFIDTLEIIFFGEITYCKGCKSCLLCENLLNS